MGYDRKCIQHVQGPSEVEQEEEEKGSGKTQKPKLNQNKGCKLKQNTVKQGIN